ncbi:MAG TPA: serine/threonine-protein kinase, partial [Anaerolineaceae bacterium]|nr:serine/threonine-protein kinase [Anaerolineaceae bacterium]
MTDNRKLGKYEIIEELGRGGFGIVYKAKDCVLDRFVALKVLHSQLSSDPEVITRIAREAKIAAALDHPNIVPVYDFDQRDGHTFIVMGFMERGSLSDLLESRGAIHPGHAKVLLEQIASGLAYAHERDIVHRDLKPANILIDANGMARISDLGFTKALQPGSLALSNVGGLPGTPAYMAPEVWGGEIATPASDVYSLGCIAHEMLTGNQLFKGETPVQVMYAHFMKSPTPIKGIAPAWQNFLARCLMTKAENRYPTASAVLEDLKWGLFDGSEKHQSEIVLTSVEDGIAPEEEIKPDQMSVSTKVSEFTKRPDRVQESLTQTYLSQYDSLQYRKTGRESFERKNTTNQTQPSSHRQSQAIP